MYGFTLNDTATGAGEEANFTDVVSYHGGEDEVRVYTVQYEKEYHLMTVPYYKVLTKPSKLLEAHGILTAYRALPPGPTSEHGYFELFIAATVHNRWSKCVSHERVSRRRVRGRRGGPLPGEIPHEAQPHRVVLPVGRRVAE